MDDALSDDVRRVLAAGIASVDDVEILFHLAQGASTASELAERTRFGEALVLQLIGGLQAAGFVEARDDRWVIATSGPDRRAIDDLLALYNARPVTLVRAIYSLETKRGPRT